MYGMVNRAILKCVEQHYGEEVFAKMLQKAGTSSAKYLSMEQYSDEESVALVVAAADAVGKSPASMLEEIGEYWIEFALNSDYGDLMRMAGDSLPDLLMNLDNMHTRVGQSFEHLEPPSFWCTDESDNSLTLHYSSLRSGLSPMVIGLVRGLGKYFAINVEVEQTAFIEQGADHDEFLVRY